MRLQKYKILLLVWISLCLLTSCGKGNSEDKIFKGRTVRKFAGIRKMTAEESVKANRINGIIDEAWRKGRFNGTFLYAENGKIYSCKAYGYADFKTKERLNVNTSFQLASVSKVFTATAIMLLAQNGYLNYDDDISKYLPGISYENITIRNLLNHRSGLQNYIYVAENYYDKNIVLHNDDILPLFRKNNIQLEFKPGARYKYCNTNYALLALIIERISKMSYASFMNTFIFKPLKMKHTFVLNVDSLNSVKSVAKGYLSLRCSYSEKVPDYLDGVTGDKGIYSSVTDLYLFDRALRNYLLLGEETLAEAYTPPVKDTVMQQKNYGFGWRIRYSDNKRIVFHNGWWKGFKVFFVRDIDADRTLICLNNRTNIYMHDVFREIFSYPLVANAGDVRPHALNSDTNSVDDNENIFF